VSVVVAVVVVIVVVVVAVVAVVVIFVVVVIVVLVVLVVVVCYLQSSSSFLCQLRPGSSSSWVSGACAGPAFVQPVNSLWLL
jgi:hypothetical protein